MKRICKFYYQVQSRREGVFQNTCMFLNEHKIYFIVEDLSK